MPTNVLLTWIAPVVQYAPGTSPGSHFLVHLGALNAQVPVTMTQHRFLDVPPGSYASRIETVSMDGTLRATHTGPTVQVIADVLIPTAQQLTATLEAA